MARYFLHLRDHSEEILDPEGVELADLGSARQAALAAARDVIASDIRRSGVIDLRFRIDVEDEAAEIVHRLSFAEAVTIIPEAK